jgi:hypothetical protein
LARPAEELVFNREKLTPDMVRFLVTETTAMTIDQAKIASDAASIVFMHTVLDAAAFDYCRVAALAAPRDWERFLKDRKVSLLDIQTSSFDALFQAALGLYLNQLERESLLRKTDLLFSLCPPEKALTAGGDKSYVFDRDRLERIDLFRHEIVHGGEIERRVENADEETDYMMSTVIHLMTLVSDRFGFKIDTDYGYALTKKSPAPPRGSAAPSP